MATFATLDEVLGAAGSDLGVTRWHTVTQEAVQHFAEATNAHEWIHVDVERARREGPFGTTVAHGYLTLSLATPFLTELLDVRGGAVGVNYGIDRARFPAPVPVGRRVRARGVLRSAERGGGGVRTVVELTFEVEGGERPPCVAEVVSLLLPPG
jgi:acyl dehydratase